MQKNHAGRAVHNYALFVHTKENPSNTEWLASVNLIDSMGQNILGNLVYTEGGSPNAIQRKQLRDVYTKHKTFPTVVLTDSAFARMAITAFNLFLPEKILPLPPTSIDEALRYVKAPNDIWPDIKKALDELKQEVGIFPLHRISK